MRRQCLKLVKDTSAEEISISVLIFIGISFPLRPQGQIFTNLIFGANAKDIRDVGNGSRTLGTENSVLHENLCITIRLGAIIKSAYPRKDIKLLGGRSTANANKSESIYFSLYLCGYRWVVNGCAYFCR